MDLHHTLTLDSRGCPQVHPLDVRNGEVKVARETPLSVVETVEPGRYAFDCCSAPALIR